MVNYENLITTVVKGLKKYLDVPVIKGNQNAEPPKYPYVTYNIVTPTGNNRGTYGEYDNGVAIKPVTLTCSITIQSDNSMESLMLANKAHDWLDFVGTTYLNDNDVIVQSVGTVSNRDNVLTVEYEYKNGFDCFFTCDDIVETEEETIERIDIGTSEGVINADDGTDDIERLEQRLDGVLGA